MDDEKFKTQEKIMKKQLLTLSLISFISSIYQLLFNIIRYHIKSIKEQYDDDDKYIKYKTYYWLFYFYLLTNLTITISNYISFYFLVNNQFKNNNFNPEENNNPEQNNFIEKDHDESLKNDINQFLFLNTKKTDSSQSYQNLYQLDEKNDF